MKVLFLDQFSELGGGQRCLADLIPAALERKWGVYVMLPREGPFADLLRAMKIEPEWLPCGPYTFGRKTWRDGVRFACDVYGQVRALSAAISRLRPDVIYANGPRLVPAAGIAAKKLPVMFHSHSYLSNWYDLALVRRQLRKPNMQVIASSRFAARPLATERLKIVYNGTAELSYKQFQRPADRPWRIGVIGRIAPEKGQLEFVRAARILHAGGLQAEYFIHGASLFSSGEYMASVRAESAGLPVHFTGWQASAGPVLHDLDLLVVPSPTFESTTRVVLEAYSAGTPVIAFATGGIPEIIDDGQTGILVRPVTSEALASAIQDATSRPHILAGLCAAGRRRWEEEFTLQRYQREVLDAIEGAGRRMNSQNSSAASSTTAAATSKTGP